MASSKVPMTSIVDIPRTAEDQDVFGIDTYMRALSCFIAHSETPITIAVQGEWGSGKTSLMNVLEKELCSEEDAEFFGVWLNTWQYSLLSDPQSTLINIVSGLSNQILEIVKRQIGVSLDDLQAKLQKGLKLLGMFAAGSAVKVAGLDGTVLNELATKRDQGIAGILEVRNQLSDVITRSLKEAEKQGRKQKGFLFFIDDLDRIDPPVAVQILELIKNIFDLKHCIFVLAIDYDVVVKGLEPKYGKLTDTNEREFRSFFDKIIQLPFTMPVLSYNVSEYIISTFRKIEFLSEAEAKDETLIRTLCLLTRLSVGTNPRALKRLTNTLSLIQIINSFGAGDQPLTGYEKVLNFGLVCLQIAYPQIYAKVSIEPSFVDWDEKVAQRWKLSPLSDEVAQNLALTGEFDEEWEQVLHRICARDSYLSNRAFLLSEFLNTLANVIPEDQEVGEVLSRIIEVSRVTSVDTKEVTESFDVTDRTEVHLGLAELLTDELKHLVDDETIAIQCRPRKHLNEGIPCYFDFADGGRVMARPVVRIDSETQMAEVHLKASLYFLSTRERRDVSEFADVLQSISNLATEKLQEFGYFPRENHGSIKDRQGRSPHKGRGYFLNLSLVSEPIDFAGDDLSVEVKSIAKVLKTLAFIIKDSEEAILKKRKEFRLRN